MARTFIAAPILVMLAVVAASAQGDVDELRTRLESRFEIVPIANGIVLTPRFRTSIKSIELSDSTIAIDGAPVTGPRAAASGSATTPISCCSFRISTPTARRSLAIGKTPPPKPADPTAPTLDPGSTDRMEPRRRAPRARGAAKTSFASAAA